MKQNASDCHAGEGEEEEEEEEERGKGALPAGEVTRAPAGEDGMEPWIQSRRLGHYPWAEGEEREAEGHEPAMQCLRLASLGAWVECRA